MPQNESISLSQSFAVYAMGANSDSVPERVFSYLKSCVADAIGLAFASRQYDYARSTAGAMQALSGGGSHPVIAGDEKLSPRDAALLNGVLIHGLDYDDTHLPSVVHCTASALPTVLALAYERGVNGRELLMALLLAIEFDARIGSAAGGKFQQRGFHPTGVVGLFGAVMAATRLLGGTNDDAVRAQGIALSTASGSMAFLDDGSWTKRLHPGWAASSAITAAHLAMAGFQGPSDPYSGRFGLYALFAGDAACAEQLADVSDSPRQWALDEVAIKPYPVCHFNHAPVDAALALRKEYALSSHQIVSGQILLHEAQFGVVVDPIERKRAPTSEYEAKFSAPYAVAAALVKGKLGLQELEADTRADPEILALAQKLTCHHDGRSVYPKAFSGGLRLTLEDGRVLESFAEVNRGAEGRLLERDLVQEKFMQNCLLTTTADHATAIWQAVMALDQLSDCRDFIDLIAMPTVASQE